MSNPPVEFKVEDSLFQYLKAGKKPWETRWREPGDPRWERLLRMEYNQGRGMMWPVEQEVAFINKATQERLVLGLLGFEIDNPSLGWVLLRLAHPAPKGSDRS